MDNQNIAGHILVAEDHDAVNWGYKLVFQLYFPDIKCSVVSSWKETAHELKRKDIKYAMALLDLQLSDTNILTHIEQLLFQYPDLKILIASTSPEQVYAADLLKSGVYGYFDKSLPTEELVFAIKTVLKGEVYTREAYRKRLTEPGMEL